MTGSVQDVLRVARGEIGVRETGGGSRGNRQRYSREMKMPDTEWCAIFVSWCLRKAGVPQAYASTRVTLFARHYATLGRFVRTPRPGDLACFDWEGDGRLNHVGIVEQVRPDGRLVTLEGNTNPGNGQDGVYRMVRSPKFVRGYCRPAYARIARAGSEPAGSPRYHLVVRGQVLSGIATKYRTTVARIQALNPQIHDVNRIFPGQRIRVR
jgi:uncharacterized protein (TIGR02594 family)